MLRTPFARIVAIHLAAIVVIGMAYGSTSHAAAPSWEFENALSDPWPAPATAAPRSAYDVSLSTHDLSLREVASLVRDGVPLARASDAIEVQSAIAQSQLVTNLEAAMSRLYAGVWFSTGTARLHIGVTSSKGRRIALGVIARAGLVADATETRVRSTYAQLLAALTDWNHRLKPLLARGEAETGLAPQNNAISIALSPSIQGRELSAIEHQAARARVRVDVRTSRAAALRSVPNASTLCKEFKSFEAYCNKPITAGVSITPEANVVCTAGPLAIPTAFANKLETYLLTAGHCLQEGGGEGKAWFATNKLKSTTEIGLAGAYIFGEKGDAGVIKVTNNSWKLPGNPPAYAVMAEWQKAGAEINSVPVVKELKSAVGSSTCREGQTTGWACGKIKEELVTSNVGVTEIHGLTEWEPGAKEKVAAGGDSGGPFYSAATGGVAEEGTLVSTSAETNNSYYEPLATTFKELSAVKGLSLELLTTISETRPPCS